jgi:hypothetical protein
MEPNKKKEAQKDIVDEVLINPECQSNNSASPYKK